MTSSLALGAVSAAGAFYGLVVAARVVAIPPIAIDVLFHLLGRRLLWQLV